MSRTGGEGERDRRSLLPLALGLALLALLLRLPFQSPVLWDHDSVQFALGVERFDLAAHQPHPPGYPLYIATLKLLSRLGVSAHAGMVGLAAAAAAVGTLFAVLLFAEITPRGAGGRRAGAALVGLLYATNPILWFYGELPLVYAVEGATAVVVAWTAWRVGWGAGSILPLAVAAGVAAGLRPSTLVLLAPLVLLATLRGLRRRSLSRRDLLRGALVLAAVGSAWGIPFLLAAGGLERYREISGAHFGYLLPRTSVLYGAGTDALAHNLEVLVKWGLQGCVAAACALAVGAVVARRTIPQGFRRLRAAGLFLAAWVLGPFLFFALFHVTKAGYTLIYLPALLLLLALPTSAALQRTWVSVLTLGAATLVGSAIFLLGSERTADQPRLLAVVRQEFNAGRIRRFGDELLRVVQLLRAQSPERSVLLTVELAGGGAAGSAGYLEPWHRHLQWYLPEHRVVLLLPEEERALESRHHQPFRSLGEHIPLPAPESTALFVLSGETGERFPLPAERRRLMEGSRFLVDAAELRTGGALPPFSFVPSSSP